MRIAVVNDSPVAVEAIVRVLSRISQYEVAWVAKDGQEALTECFRSRPDLILMDLFMPQLDGVAATREIMARTPCAILVVTATVDGHAAKAFEALSAGALDVVQTPRLGALGGNDGVEAFLEKIDVLGRLVTGRSVRPRVPAPPPAERRAPLSESLVVIGASAGGPAALGCILHDLPRDFPAPLILIQHVDVQFALLMAQWLQEQSAIPVRLAREGDQPQPGVALLAATNDHLIFKSPQHLGYTQEPVAAPYRPSVDVFFESVCEHWKGEVLGVLLTGMGRDGAKGLLRLRQAGALTLAQDRESSVVYGMPKAAMELKAATEVLPLDQIGARIARRFRSAV